MKPSNVFPLPGESIEAKKQRRKVERREASAGLYGAAVARMLAGGRSRCELCESPRLLGGLEEHHVEGGSGRRREKQCLANVVLVCTACHALATANHKRYFDLLRAFLARHGYPEPACLRRR